MLQLLVLRGELHHSLSLLMTKTSQLQHKTSLRPYSRLHLAHLHLQLVLLVHLHLHRLLHVLEPLVAALGLLNPLQSQLVVLHGLTTLLVNGGRLPSISLILHRLLGHLMNRITL